MVKKYKVKVVDEREYILKKDATTVLILDDEDDNYGTLKFYGEYHWEKDEGGHHPPWYLSQSGLIRDWAEEALEEVEGGDEFWMYNATLFTMETCYVLPIEVKSISAESLEDCKMTRYKARVTRRVKNKHKNIENKNKKRKNSDSDEEDSKEEKERDVDEKNENNNNNKNKKQIDSVEE